AAPRQPLDAEPLPADDEDVHAAVLEALEHLRHARPRPRLAHAGLVRVDDAELAVELQALADQLLVALLEDVERRHLGRQEDDPEREEADLIHPPQGTLAGLRLEAWR